MKSMYYIQLKCYAYILDQTSNRLQAFRLRVVVEREEEGEEEVEEEGRGNLQIREYLLIFVPSDHHCTQYNIRYLQCRQPHH